MIRGAFLHLPGIGPERLRRLQAAGITTWSELRASPDAVRLAPGPWDRLLAELDRCEEAAARGDLKYLVETFSPRDHWRILAEHFEAAAYFDLETSGLGPDSYVTVIACWADRRLHTYVRGRNLDEFLALLEDVRLLVSFNGASFDVPHVTRAFHIPGIPCAHIDLRWLCHHQQLGGGLKQIERRLAIQRPPELVGMDGADAVWLWDDYLQRDDTDALHRLVRYCAVDVLSLHSVAGRLLRNLHCAVPCPEPTELWKALDQNAITAPTRAQAVAASPRAAQQRMRSALRAARST